jgi:hypothetical protein
MPTEITDPVAIAHLNFTSGNQNQAGGVPGLTPDTEGLTGEDYLNAVFPGDNASKAAVRAISQYKMAGTGRNIQKLMPHAAAYDPTFDQTRYLPNIALRKSFESGADADNVKSYITAINHASGLDDAVNRMNNFTRAPHLLNSISQSVKYNSGNEQFQAALEDFRAHKTGVASELAKAFRNAGMAEADVQHWMDQIQETDSPVALHQAVRSAMGMLGGRMEATLNKWNSAMPNQPKTVDQLLGPSAANYHRILAPGLMGGTQGAPQSAQTPQGGMGIASGPQNAPAAAPGRAPGAYTEGQTATNRSTGERMIFRGGQWQPLQ